MLLGLVLLVLLPLRGLTSKIFELICLHEVNIQIDEDLATYYWAVEKEDRRETILDELNMRNTYNIKMMPDEVLRAYEEAQDVENSIQGVHNYDILSNPSYIQQFQYLAE